MREKAFQGKCNIPDSDQKVPLPFLENLLTKLFFTTDIRRIFCKSIWDTLSDIFFTNFFFTDKFASFYYNKT